jgi:hypothetical protein
MSRLPVNCRNDQKEINNGTIQGDGSFMGAQLCGWSFGCLDDWQSESKRFGNGHGGRISANACALGKS